MAEGWESRLAHAGVVAEAQLYWLLLRAQARAQFQYRASFLLQALGQFVATFVGFVALLLLFHRFPSLAGWTFGEVAFLYGLSALAFGISDLICGGFDSLSPMIRTGSFDRVLTRPVGVFVQILASDLQIRRLGRIVQGLATLAVALTWLDVAWTPAKVLVAVMAAVSGATIFVAIWVIGAAVTFWTVQTSEVTNVFTYGGEELTSYPLPIFAEGLRRFFTFVVPLAFVSYLPALYILDHPDPLGLPPALQLCSPLVAAGFFVVARLTWAFGVRHYQSTGA
ncbi:MAG: ABC-2 family transporter protein [Chloroflexi bacterium]|nr:ABC-2 family transporter protein [Chloroflexota bacterium]